VDIDPLELKKPTVKPDLAILCDLKTFITELNRQVDEVHEDSTSHAAWLAWCKERVEQYPAVLPRHRTDGKLINPYHFIEQLFVRLEDDDVIVCGNGSACVVTFQAASIKKGQRLFTNSGCASMGYDLPAAIGAAVARAGKRVICLAGDGSLQMNIQELQTVVQHRLPIKLLVLNNAGYLSIRNTQQAFFGDYIGEGPESGVTFPDIVRVAGAYGIDALRAHSSSDWDWLDHILKIDGPVVCEVMLDPAQQFEPKLSSRQLADGRIVSSALEDLWPFLDRDELRNNLLIPALE
jgi:acetolactate synthase I/II/III large subunit